MFTLKFSRKLVFGSILAGSYIIAPMFTKAQVRNDKQLSNRVSAFSPEEQLKRFKLPEGFIAELVVSEKEGIVKPIDIAFDDAGNLWTQTGKMYPLDPISDINWSDLLELMDNPTKQKEHPAFQRVSALYKGSKKGEDQILKITGMGTAQKKVSVWADGLAIPMSILPYKNGVYVAQGSEVFFLNDSNKDGKADQRKPIFTGFGFTDTHTMAHLLRKGPGGWIHFSHGALNKGEVTAYDHPNVRTRFDYSKIGRFTHDGSKLEVVNAGLNNIWGYTLRANGQWYGSEANDLGYSVVPLDEGAAYPGIGNDKFRTYQPFYPPVHSLRTGGTGLSGLTFSEDDRGGFPDEWKNVAFLANPITNSINAVKIIQHPDGRIESQRLDDLLVSEDDWFRPVNLVFGPDGALYVADWYNKIVSHNEVPTTHPDRDKVHGRIWRIRHKSQVPRDLVNFYAIKTKDLPAYLKSPFLWERRSAWNQIAERNQAETKSLLPHLVDLVQDTNLGTSSRIHALWSLESLTFYDESVFKSLLNEANGDLQRETLRYLEAYSEKLVRYESDLLVLSKSSNANVRAQVVRTIGKVPVPTTGMFGVLLLASTRPEGELKVGGSYEKAYEGYWSRRVLERFPHELESYLKGVELQKYPQSNLVWAINVLPPINRAPIYFALKPDLGKNGLSESEFLEVGAMASVPQARQLLEKSLAVNDHRKHYLYYARAHQNELPVDIFSEILTAPATASIQQEDTDERVRALEVVISYRLPVLEEVIVKAGATIKDEWYKGLILRTLDAIGAKGGQYYCEVANDLTLTLGTRLNALQGLIRADKTKGVSETEKILASMDGVERRLLTNVLSRYTASAVELLNWYSSKKLQKNDFEIMTAERIHSVIDNKIAAQKLVTDIRKVEEERKANVSTRIKSLRSATAKLKGNAEKGKVFFQTCLMCHQANGIGQSFAPSLDGLAYRDLDGLFHAVLDPDAAIEAGYAMYRVIKKDNSILEGFLVKNDHTGLTLGSMGGAQTFIAVSDVKTHHSVAGKSFMPEGLFDQMSHQDVADLLSYIKTIQ